jgi:hypothetical protein
MTKEYWVVGGDYRDATFTDIEEGKSEVYGPFLSYEDALADWREKNADTRPLATRRYSVVVTAAPVWR